MMDLLFSPRSLAVVGVSADAANLGRVIVENLQRFSYRGDLHLVGRRAGNLDGKPIITVEQLPSGVDLAVILTPAATVPSYLEACGQKGVRWAVVESGGFSEFSADGRRLEEECLAIARRYGMRFVGPNCLGINNPARGVATSFLPTQPGEIRAGRIALLAQSGGVVLTCADVLAADGLGVSKTVSVGNKTDLKEADYLRYFLDDPDTDVVILYLESILDGRALVDLARAGRKPVLVFKSNTGPASARAAASHTAALANDEQVIDAAFRQSGKLLRLRRFSEMATFGKAFAMAPVGGRRLAVFSRSGGHAIVAADCATEFGFDLPPFSQAVLDAARPYFRAAIMDTNNPLDLGTVFDFYSYTVMVEACLKDMRPDAVMLVFNYRRDDIPVARRVAARLAEFSRQYHTPIALVYFMEGDEIHDLQKNLGFPVFTEVYEAMQALAASRDLEERRRQQDLEGQSAGSAVEVTAEVRDRVAQILDRCQQEGRQPLVHEALEVCRLYGLPVASAALATTREEAPVVAEQVGYPLAVKAVAPGLSHKSDAGGVALGIKDAQELEQAIQGMAARLARSTPGEAVTGYLLQQMAPPGGRELILGGKRDKAFGPLVLLGLGGIYAEIFRDTAIRLAPVSKAEARQMVASLRGRGLLEGARRQEPADLNLVADCTARLSQLMVDFPAILEFDANPLMVYPSGGVVVDARIAIFISAMNRSQTGS